MADDPVANRAAEKAAERLAAIRKRQGAFERHAQTLVGQARAQKMAEDKAAAALKAAKEKK